MQPTLIGINSTYFLLSVLSASILSTASAILFSVIWKMKNSKRLLLQIFYMIISGISVLYPNSCRIFSWIIFITSIPMAITSPNMLLTRLFALVLAIQSVYQLFSLTYEALFLTFLALTLSTWLYMEHVQVTTLLDLNQVHLHETTRQRFVINSDDLKRALAFLTFTIGEFSSIFTWKRCNFSNHCNRNRKHVA